MIQDSGNRLTRKTQRKASGKKRGQSLAEFALVLPVLLLVIFGIVDFGWMLFNYVSLDNGLREGLRYASVAGYGADPQYFQCDSIRNQIVTRAGSSGIRLTDIGVTYDKGDPAVSPIGSCPAGATITNLPIDNGYRVVVDVNVTVNFLTPLIRIIAPGGMNIHLNGARSIYPRGF